MTHSNKISTDIARKENDKLEEQRALATIGHTYLTSYLDTSDEENQTALTLAYKSFKKSLIICERYYFLLGLIFC